MDEASLAAEIVDELRARHPPGELRRLPPEALAREVLVVEREFLPGREPWDDPQSIQAASAQKQWKWRDHGEHVEHTGRRGGGGGPRRRAGPADEPASAHERDDVRGRPTRR